METKVLSDLAAANFWNLREIKVYGSQSMINAHNTFDLLSGKDTRSIPMLSALHRDTLLSWPFDLYEQTTGHYVDRIRSEVNESTHAILDSMVRLGRKIRIMDFDVIAWSMWKDPAYRMAARDYQVCAKIIMQTVRHLNVQFFLRTLESYAQEPRSISYQLTEFLNSAACLEVAELDFIEYSNDRPTDEDDSGHASQVFEWNAVLIPDISDVFANVSWPRLREFRVQRCGLTAHAFNTFMQRHNDTMRVFEVYDLQMVPSEIGNGLIMANTDWQPAIDMSGPSFPGMTDERQIVLPNTDWQPVLETIAPIMSLQSAKVSYLYDDIERAKKLRIIGSVGDKRPLPYVKRHEEALRQWEEYGRRVSAYLQQGGTEPYPAWDGV
ncbi:MAG: hypothetical protein Q9218_004654 [Villophora microphyllina]